MVEVDTESAAVRVFSSTKQLYIDRIATVACEDTSVFFISYVFIGKQDGMSPPVGKVVLKLLISGLVKTVDFSREIISFQDHQVLIDW